MSMRKQFVDTTTKLMESDKKIVTLLGDIGVFGFRHLMQKYPERVYNIGILEQATISMASGMALCGIIPFVHTISPFIVERAYEQLKLNFGYQECGGNFIGVGGSYDYSKLGSTHSCPADVGALRQIPNMEIVLPGTDEEFDTLLMSAYNNGRPTYFRLSERCNRISNEVVFGRGNVIKKGQLGTAIVVGNLLDKALDALGNLDVTILYYTTVKPFDKALLKEYTVRNHILLIEPYYYGTLSEEIISSFPGESLRLDFIGVPHEFLTNYGNVEENDEYCNITSYEIRRKMENLIYE